MSMGVIPLFDNSAVSTDFEIVAMHPELPHLDAVAETKGVVPLGTFFEWDPDCAEYTYHDSKIGVKSVSALIDVLQNSPPDTIAAGDLAAIATELKELQKIMENAVAKNAGFVLAAVY